MSSPDGFPSDSLQNRVYSVLKTEMGEACSATLMDHARLVTGRLTKSYAYFASAHALPRMSMWYYNPHDREHILRVLEVLDKLVPDGLLSAYELFILYLAAWGHDIGMCVPGLISGDIIKDS